MKIIDLLNEDKVTLSFEVFPPKTSSRYENVLKAAEKIASLNPNFMSVTYGAGGGTSAHTVALAKDIHEKYGVEVMAHLTCVSSTKEHVESMVEQFKENGIENIMALRGDIPSDGKVGEDYQYACQLIKELKEKGDFCIGAACYPEGHVESPSIKEDIQHLKEKVEAGADFLTTQMFFDNNVFYNFLYKIKEAGIDVPVVAGIMPITNAKQVSRAVQMSGTSIIPYHFKMMVDAFGDNPEIMKQAGIIYASEQIIDLIANGVKHIHVYTMNKPDVAEGIMNNLSELLK
ncbi:methylenetetrahydrofolate reductase [NAD(P)H] [Catenibacterium mitsuokai]|uniref:methylenetetrahydrofolate reductase [NAD(P)H] n=1 Tax=Catenibacterium mitsuokai TaxID=100886 RepID=UPI001C017018|nr:methylenetetrahydrofolate reductase [NAD(P)H] [Catenibacterium mitsuokai]MBT9814217.1 methylenetetrahydrofolate reductase [NAD(P)H] [Catenibacterium mitsuokai]MEE0335296.1 methylenetetrahydrofolate reductase [NAD(P)H] [Catenibacterium mitsuokai]